MHYSVVTIKQTDNCESRKVLKKFTNGTKAFFSLGFVAPLICILDILSQNLNAITVVYLMHTNSKLFTVFFKNVLLHEAL